MKTVLSTRSLSTCLWSFRVRTTLISLFYTFGNVTTNLLQSIGKMSKQCAPDVVLVYFEDNQVLLTVNLLPFRVQSCYLTVFC